MIKLTRSRSTLSRVKIILFLLFSMSILSQSQLYFTPVATFTSTLFSPSLFSSPSIVMIFAQPSDNATIVNTLIRNSNNGSANTTMQSNEIGNSTNTTGWISLGPIPQVTQSNETANNSIITTTDADTKGVQIIEKAADPAIADQMSASSEIKTNGGAEGLSNNGTETIESKTTGNYTNGTGLTTVGPPRVIESKPTGNVIIGGTTSGQGPFQNQFGQNIPNAIDNDIISIPNLNITKDQALEAEQEASVMIKAYYEKVKQEEEKARQEAAALAAAQANQTAEDTDEAEESEESEDSTMTATDETETNSEDEDEEQDEGDNEDGDENEDENQDEGEEG